MRMLNEACKCIDEDWKALKARIQASITGITVNGTTHYQTDGTGICDLGDIKGTDDADEIFMNDGRSVETAVTEDESAIKEIVKTIPGLVQDVAPNAVDNGINIQVTDGNGTIDRMLIRADDSLSFDGLQIGISEATDGRITQAQADATDAGTKADDAQTDATDALSKADVAQTTADTALTKASTAQSTADTAKTTADGAQTDATNALAKANEAIVSMEPITIVSDDYTGLNLIGNKNSGKTTSAQLIAMSTEDFTHGQQGNYTKFSLSEAIKTKINGAISAIAANNVDTALEMNIDKADGSTATVPLFTAGENLTWDGTTLNASGGSGGVLYTTLNDYLNGTPRVGDIIIVAQAVGFSGTLTIPTSYAISTGTYGAEMHPTSVSTGTVIMNLDNLKLITIFAIYNIVNDRLYTTNLCGSGYNIKPASGSVSTTVSIDEADSIEATMNITIPAYAPIQTTAVDTWITKSNPTTFKSHVIQGQVAYEGVSAQIPCKITNVISGTSNIYVIQGQR